jgi:hypothetical protein
LTTTVDEERRRIMGKLVVTEFVTLDGEMEDPGGAETFDRGGGATSSLRGSWRRSPMEQPDR